MRAGAPDKINQWHAESYDIKQLDKTNLVDYSFDKLKDIITSDSKVYFLPADEGDIRHANELLKVYPNLDQRQILLPMTKSGNKYQIIDHKFFASKGSLIYKDLQKMDYAVPQTFVKVEDFEGMKTASLGNVAIKSEFGSGSRGVILIDPDRTHLGGAYVDKFRVKDKKRIIKTAKDTGSQYIIVQELINPNLLKCNTDFIIRNGRLLGYRWDVVQQDQQFTNWDSMVVIRDAFTDKIMNNIANLLINKYHITDAIMNFESFYDAYGPSKEFKIIEFNWRYSNSMFSFEPFQIDPIECYLFDYKFEIPYGKHPCHRYWRCGFRTDFLDT